MNQQQNNQMPITNQQLEQINANLNLQIRYLRTINDNLVSTNDKLTGIILIFLLPMILSAGFIILGIALIAFFGINIFSWLF